MSAVGLFLAHGAGGGPDHRLFLRLEDELPIPVRRHTFPYRAEGRRAPDRAPKLLASVRHGVLDFADELGCDPTELVLGGRSMGGRICSMAVADDLGAAGLVLLSYPLHPPGKPDRLRIDHFGSITVPTLMLNGDRDPFGTPDEVMEHVAAIPGPVELHWLEGHRHDPKPSADDEIVSVVGRFVSAL